MRPANDGPKTGPIGSRLLRNPSGLSLMHTPPSYCPPFTYVITGKTLRKREWVGSGCIVEARRISENACRPPIGRRPSSDRLFTDTAIKPERSSRSQPTPASFPETSHLLMGRRLLLAFFLLFHDLQDGFIGFDHTLVAQGAKILDGLFRGLADNAVGVLYVYALQGE